MDEYIQNKTATLEGITLTLSRADTTKPEWIGQDEMAILQYHLPFAESELLKMTVNFLQRSHQLDLDFSPRDGLHILQYAMKRLTQDKDHPLSKDVVWKEAVQKVLGDDALDLDGMAEKKNRALGETQLPQGLGDFFFDEDSPLHPDR